jgi:two-component system chemotaxis sensor kinase CheA
MDDEIIREFLVESNENLSRLDQEMVQLERNPADAALLASIFRTIHTIKGTCGFLGFDSLENLAHFAENILSQVRAGAQGLTPEIASILLETVDAIKEILGCIEASGSEGAEKYEDLCTRLTQIADSRSGASVAASNAPAPELINPGAVSSHSTEVALERPLSGALIGAAPASPAPVTKKPESSFAQVNSDGPRPSVADSTIRVDVCLLDRLMNLVGELVLARNQILQLRACQEDQAVNATCQRLNVITTELQESVMKTRMQPIGVVWNKFPRVVRDLAGNCGKQITLEMEGIETELDKTLIEAIKDPLTHVVRNCCDHGIERPEVRVGAGKRAQGRLLLRAFHEGGHVNIEITDDGRGIDPERVKSKAVQKGLIRPEEAARMSDREAAQLVFLPGFSTAEQVTSISGRGVGMDVVKTNIEKIGGVVDLSSSMGRGTTVRIKIPLTLAIIPGLVVTSAGMTFIIPQASLVELIRLEGQAKQQIEYVGGTAVYRHRGKLLPIAHLDQVLQVGDTAERDVLNIVVLQGDDHRLGLVVDSINDTQEIVVKPLGKLLKAIECFAGATIMGDGKVALILDVAGVCKRAGLANESHGSGKTAKNETVDLPNETQPLLLLSAGVYERVAVPLSSVTRLEEIPFAQVERASGELVVQYRDCILPLVYLSANVGSNRPAINEEREVLPVVVFRDGGRQLGLVVDRIIDIVESQITHRRPSTVPGLLGSAVAGGKITDFLDLEPILRSLATWNIANELPSTFTIILADDSPFSRSMMRSHLEMSGHRVFEAASVTEALECLANHRAEIFIANPRLPGGGAGELRSRLLAHSKQHHVPIIAAGSSAAQIEQLKHMDAGFDAFCLQSEPVSILESVRHLAEMVGNTALECEQAGEIGLAIRTTGTP